VGAALCAHSALFLIRRHPACCSRRERFAPPSPRRSCCKGVRKGPELHKQCANRRTLWSRNAAPSLWKCFSSSTPSARSLFIRRTSGEQKRWRWRWKTQRPQAPAGDVRRPGVSRTHAVLAPAQQRRERRPGAANTHRPPLSQLGTPLAGPSESRQPSERHAQNSGGEYKEVRRLRGLRD